ncbi:MAG: winged helix-turn-helix transcriptional regulator [Endomicrobium sp.]|jgi:hypothetical protein|nr:winged helix-turn-helix transcriptional regulator [Endomicrobium sp.]
MNNAKISIRFFDDKEVRAVWDGKNNKWWFSVVDVVSVLNEENDYIKAGNYWRWLKRKLKQENIQFVSDTHRLKLMAADGKNNTLKNRELHISFIAPKKDSLNEQGFGVKLGANGNILGVKLGVNQSKIIDIIQSNPNITIVEISKLLKISTTAIENNIKKLKSLGILSR